MLTVSGICKCPRCETRTSSIYRMVGSCSNCKTKPILMLFRAGDKTMVLGCPACGVRAVSAERIATEDEIPLAEKVEGV